MVERDLRATIQSDEAMTIEFKLDNQHVAGLVAVKLLARIRVALDVRDLGVGKDRDVKVGGIFGLAVEPEAGCEFERREGHLNWRFTWMKRRKDDVGNLALSLSLEY